MVNTEEFALRLQKILEYYELSAAAFADKIEVGRSSISHILSGRNKPSLDFVMKVIKTFPEVELYWLLNGKGEFPAGNRKSSPEIFSGEPETVLTQKENEVSQIPLNNTQKSASGKEIKKVVLFYTDGTFEAFEN